MGIYYGILVALAVFQVIGINMVQNHVCSYTQHVHRWLIVSWILLSAVAGFRDLSVGTDTYTYAKIFVYEIPTQLNRFEWGFELLTKFIRLITDNPTIYLTIVAFIINGLILLAIYRISVQPFVSVYMYILLYYYFNTFNGMRQYLAIAFLLHAFYYAKEKNWKKYLSFQFLALSFHMTALVGVSFILVPFISIKTQSSCYSYSVAKSLGKILAMICIASVSFASVLRLLVVILPQYRGYLDSNYMLVGGGINKLVLCLGSFLLFLIFTDPRKTEHKIIEYPLAIATSLAFITLKFSLVGRMVWYFDIFLIFILAYIWKCNIVKYNAKILIKIGILGIGILYMTYYLSVNAQRVVPYSLIF